MHIGNAQGGPLISVFDLVSGFNSNFSFTLNFSFQKNQRLLLIVILITFFSEFSSSDGQTDLAFGESIISMSPFSTTVTGHPSV